MKKATNQFYLGQFNHIVRGLIISDIATLSAFGLLAPIFAVFVVNGVAGANIQTAGIATTIFLLARSVGQIPIGILIDRLRGERDEFVAMIIGTLVMSFVPLLYIFVEFPWQLYLVQFIYGLAAAVVFPAWMATFTRHIDPMHEGLEWGVYRSFVDIGTAFAAGLGGVVAVEFGFNAVFYCVSFVALIGCGHLIYLRRQVLSV